MGYSHQTNAIVPIFLLILVFVLSSELPGEVVNSEEIENVNEPEKCGYKAYPAVCHALLKKYEPEYEKFRRVQTGDKIVYFHQRTIGDAIVQEDQIVYHFDKRTGELLNVKVHWTDDLPAKLPEIMSNKDAEAMVEGEIQFSQLFYITPDSYVFPAKHAPENPCWIIESVKDNTVTVTVIDAVEGQELGHGVPPPFGASCVGGEGYAYSGLSQDANEAFNAMGYTTELAAYPTHPEVQKHIQSHETSVFYGIAHGDWHRFRNRWDDRITADEIKTWIAAYHKMPFAFIGSCGGMCETGYGSLSWAFRKGSNEDTVTIGYCNMGSNPCSAECWFTGYAKHWQKTLLRLIKEGWTVRAAFDQANAEYPGCALNGCMKFEGDENLTLVPPVPREPEPRSRLFVDSRASGGGNDGTSWENAFRFLQDALSRANSAAKPAEIWVAQGTYKPDQGEQITPGDRSATFQLINGVTIKGGYAGLGAPDPNSRDIQTQETILSGDLKGDDEEVCDSCALLSDPNRADNSYHVVTGDDTNEIGILDGFTIMAGNADGKKPNDRGAGVYLQRNSITIVNCTIASNSASNGGGVCCYNRCSPTFINCKISKNVADHMGGGMYNSFFVSPTLINCIFNGNFAGFHGGGICSYAGSVEKVGSSLTLRNCTFAANYAPTGNALACDSYQGEAPSNIQVINCIVRDSAPEIWNNDNSTISITYSSIRGGWPGQGNIDDDPCFADPNDGDYHLKSQAGRWDPNHRTWVYDDLTSPCIDAGNPGTLLGQEPIDPRNVRINMGAYGGTAEASMPTCSCATLADLNNDRRVDFDDF